MSATAASASSSSASSSSESTTEPTYKILCCNAFLIPSLLFNLGTFYCFNQSERATLLGKLVMEEKPDVVCCQEFWGAGQQAFETEVCSSDDDEKDCYVIPDALKSYGGWQLIDSISQKKQQRGGLYWASRKKSVECLPFSSALSNSASPSPPTLYKQIVFSASKSNSNKGCMMMKFALTDKSATEEKNKSKKKRTHLLVFNTHTDPNPYKLENAAIQRIQLSEIAQFIRQSCLEELAQHQQQQERKETEQEPEVNFAALLVGDFNFTPDSEQFQNLFKIGESNGVTFRKQFLPESSLSTHTYSEKNPLVKNKKAVGRLDHVFVVDSVSSNNKSKQEQKEKASQKIDLLPLQLVNDKVHSDVLCSDHFAWSFEVRF